MIRGQVVAVALALAALGACSGSDGASPAPPGSATEGPRALTSDEAAMLSQVLFANLEAGGAQVEIEATVDDGATFVLSGEIDWQDHEGRVTSDRLVEGQSTGQRQATWNDTEVYEGGIDGLEAALAAEGRPGIQWVRRPMDTEGIGFHRILAAATALAATQRDNPVLLLQGDAQLLRRDQVAGTPVRVFQYGSGTVLWVGVDDGLLRRADLDLQGFPEGVRFDLRGHGRHDVQLPPTPTVADLADVRTAYDVIAG